MASNKDIINKPLFWVRDKEGASAELDFLVRFEGKAIPVEVKSGKNRKIKIPAPIYRNVGNTFSHSPVCRFVPHKQSYNSGKGIHITQSAILFGRSDKTIYV